jgi:pimeloyl-ACP methyl ester carboxylesterase
VREIVQVAGAVGTYHAPEGPSPKRVAYLFVNPGHVPRDGHGGLAAKACDRLAARGYPCFRFDLPALGDSPGPLPTLAEELYAFVADAGYVPVTLDLMSAIRERHPVDGVVLGGLCGAAVTGIYAADRAPGAVRGLILFEPELFRVAPQGDDARATAEEEQTNGRMKRVTSKLFSYWGWMTILTMENQYAKYVPLPREAILRVLMNREDLPSVANVPLVEAWQRVVGRRTPTLVVTAKGKVREVFFDRINRVALKRVPTASMEHVRLEGTNHIFTTGGAIDRVIGLLERWSDEHLR